MRWVTATHAIRWHQHRRTVGQGPVYQARYFATPIEHAPQLIMTCRYVERNALSAGLVHRAQDWPWCSLAERMRSAPEVALVPAPFLLSPAWKDYVNAVLTTRERLRQPTSVPTCGNPVENTSVP
jgi:putative transposase